jgi:hypothetical protein
LGGGEPTVCESLGGGARVDPMIGADVGATEATRRREVAAAAAGGGSAETKTKESSSNNRQTNGK